MTFRTNLLITNIRLISGAKSQMLLTLDIIFELSDLCDRSDHYYSILYIPFLLFFL
jgi:hypothetical protein